MIPIQLFPTNHTVRTEAEKNLHSRTTIVGGKKLIEEIEPSDTSAVHSKKGSTATGAISPHPDKSESTSVVPKAPIKSILKTAKQITSQSAVANNKINNNYLKNDDVSSERPSFSWSKEENRLRLEVHVPKLVSDALTFRDVPLALILLDTFSYHSG